MHPFPAAAPVALPGRGVTLSTHQMGSGPAVVFCHGFPDLAFGWRYQLAATAAAGFHAIAPDQRGYGGSTAPAEVEAYGLTELTGDLVGLLDALEIERACFVGHDWGGFVAWAMAVLHPSRVMAVAGLCTPYIAFPSVATHGRTDRQTCAESVAVLVCSEQPPELKAALEGLPTQREAASGSLSAACVAVPARLKPAWAPCSVSSAARHWFWPAAAAVRRSTPRRASAPRAVWLHSDRREAARPSRSVG